MPKHTVLIEVMDGAPQAFKLHAAARESLRESESQVEKLAKGLAGLGVDIDASFPPVPMFFGLDKPSKTHLEAFGTFAAATESSDAKSASFVLRAEVDAPALKKLKQRQGVRVYPASRLYLFAPCSCGGSPAAPALDGGRRETVDDELELDWGHTAGSTDCRPFRAGVSMARIRALLGVSAVWRDGFRGQNVVVAIVDEGANGAQYPVIGGYAGSDAPAPGSAPVTSHGSMCAADVLVAAPFAKLYDYPLIAEATSAEGFQMYQQILNQRRTNGTPQVTSNSYGFYGIPTRQDSPEHEAWDINHPFHRKVREVVASGAAVFFAAGNCGTDCPSGNCRDSAIGPGRSINASAALAEVFTIAAVNSRHERVGYSSQGPSLHSHGFAANKPDFASYTHFFGNFGPGRPGGTTSPFDNGTSAATPTAAGVAALLLSRFRTLKPDRLREAFKAGAIEIGQPGWDALTGSGVVNPAAAYARLLEGEA